VLRYSPGPPGAVKRPPLAFPNSRSVLYGRAGRFTSPKRRLPARADFGIVRKNLGDHRGAIAEYGAALALEPTLRQVRKQERGKLSLVPPYSLHRAY
jgi:hypothetical protein